MLVRLVACGVCHTDLYTASGADPSGYAPTVLGHEGAGVVERIGDGVTSVAPGDHVVTLFSPQCRECVHCLDARTNLCLAIREQQNQGYLPDGTTRLARGGEPIRHFMGTSTFAEYTVMPEIALAKISPEAPLDRACVFACGLSTGLGAAMNTAKVQAGSTCVVFGAGLVGLGAVAGCRLQGAERIVAVDLSPERLELARGQGATDAIAGGPDTVQQVLDLTGGFGADYTFEATGNVGVMRQAVESARMGWGLATVCGVAGKGETLDVVPRFLITGRRVAGLVVRRRQGPRRRAAARRSLARRRDRRRPAHLPPSDARRGEPRVRADGGAGRDPQRDRVRVLDSVVTAIAQLEENRTVEGVYAVAKKERLRTRNGAAYLALELVDPSGRISARVWNDVELLDARFAEGDAVRVLGRVERFRDRLQLEVRTLEPAADVDPASMAPAMRRDADELEGFLEFLVAEISHEGLQQRRGAGARRGDDRVDARAARDARRAPLVRGRAARAHGRRRDALPRDRTAPSAASPDLLLAAALVHDVGRTVELGRGPVFRQTDEGRLLGHVHLGLRLIEERAAMLDTGVRAELLHAVACHHDVRAARTAEAAVLYHANQLDAVAATRPVSD